MRGLRKSGIGRTERYDRSFDLPRLVAVWPQELADDSVAGRARMLARLEQALRAERQRGAAGHWTYDVSRHAQLILARWAEARELAEARRRGRRVAHKAGLDAAEVVRDGESTPH